MFEVIKAIVLGIIQGLTEFLPVSSSGHLEIAKAIMGEEAIGKESLIMTVVLHFATALSTIFIFRNEILNIIKGMFSKDEERNFTIKIILSMIPAVFVGLTFEKEIESLFTNNLFLVGAMLILTGVLLYYSQQKRNNTKEISYASSIIIGISQAIAILPGISRSGATIATALILGIDKSKAAKFSFLMVVPLILGKIAKILLLEDISIETGHTLPLFFGFIAAFLVGLLACTWMINFVKKSKLNYFAYYCFIAGLLTICLRYFQII